MKKSKLLRMDNVAIVVSDLKKAIAFFEELGLQLEAQMPVKGEWVDRIVGLKNVENDIAMMRTPDGHSRLELMKFNNPEAIGALGKIPVNTFGIRRLMFAVEDLEEVLARLKGHGAELIGDVVRFENSYLLCYLTGPECITIALAQPLNSEVR